MFCLTGAFNHQTERGMRSWQLETLNKKKSFTWMIRVCATLIKSVLRGNVCCGMFESISSRNIWDLGYKRNMLRGIFVFNSPHTPGEYKTWNGGPSEWRKREKVSLWIMLDPTGPDFERHGCLLIFLSHRVLSWRLRWDCSDNWSTWRWMQSPKLPGTWPAS